MRVVSVCAGKRRVYVVLAHDSQQAVVQTLVSTPYLMGAKCLRVKSAEHHLIAAGPLSKLAWNSTMAVTGVGHLQLYAAGLYDELRLASNHNSA